MSPTTQEQTFHAGEVFQIRLRTDVTVRVSDITAAIEPGEQPPFGKSEPWTIVLSAKGEKLLGELFHGLIREAIDVDATPSGGGPPPALGPAPKRPKTK